MNKELIKKLKKFNKHISVVLSWYEEFKYNDNDWQDFQKTKECIAWDKEFRIMSKKILKATDTE